MGSVGMEGKQVQKIHGGLRENPAHPVPQGHGECMKDINNHSVLWQWDTGWVEELSNSELSSSEVGTVLTWTIHQVNITFTCVYFPQRT